ncbi:DUF4382 domain-containing protein [Halorubrum trapanicum]|uniref:DUF4382 domain-containing protein n=1 Tax=Halorubrum trapanicum TaxID=29284 RepID=UPI003C6EE5E1
MTDRSQTTSEDGSRADRSRKTGDGRAADATDTSGDGVRRREFVALGAGATATLLAGCAGDASLPSSGGSGSSDGSDGSDGSETLTGNFRLLISDAPADIGDFDRLDVTLDRARVFEAGDDEDDDDDDEEEADEDDEANDDTDQNATETDDDDESLNETADEDDANETDVDDGGDDEEEVEAEDEDDDEEDDEADDEEDEGRGFTVVELDGATVDLTQVIDEDAIAVFDGEIPAGSYEKIELEVSAVEGVVDGETVDVKLPSEKLQITNGFEVTPDEPVSFVFDINVVKRGKNNGYILKPVISGSGVAGRDVDVNEIDDDDDDEDSEDDEEAESEDGDSETDEEDDATGGNETDDAENETASGS